MSAQITQLKDFFRRLQQESNDKPFVWLIGAGMSVSSGIPLAVEVSEKIILFEFYLENGGSIPWIKGKKSLENEYDEYSFNGLNYKSDLEDYLDWFDLCKHTDSFRENYLTPAINWLNKKDGFKDITPENPECYQRLFKYFFQEEQTSTRFLIQLIKRAKGINLAHLALAGILRDYKELGNTVFTTNFDDLLLKALLQLNHSARVFGEFETSATPGTKPNFPQIVHLHGKHTGYNLKNSENQVSFIKPKLQEGFKAHIKEFNLIVIGYSGWDDLVMKTLNEWNTNPELINGNIYWIPYQSEETILPKVKDFLDSLPEGRVHIIVDKSKNSKGLDADSFMLAFCRFINRKRGGFSPYRSEIIQNAENQHKFVLNELKKHPSHSPDRALRLIDEAKELYLETNDKDLTIAKLQIVFNLLKAKDIPIQLKASCLQKIAQVQILLFDYEGGIKSLEKSIILFKQYSNPDESAILGRLVSHLGLCEVYLKTSNLDNLIKNARQALSKYHSLNLNYPSIACKLMIFFCYQKLAKGYPIEKRHFEEAYGFVAQTDNPDYWKAEFDLIKGIYYNLLSEFTKAEKIIKASITTFREFKILSQLANALLNLSNSYISLFKPEQVEVLLKESLEIYKELNDELGIANTHSTYGTMYFRMRDFDNALNKFREAKNIYTVHNQIYNISNSLTDICLVYKELENKDKLKIYLDELLKISIDYRSPYTKFNLENNLLIIQSDEEE